MLTLALPIFHPAPSAFALSLSQTVDSSDNMIQSAPASLVLAGRQSACFLLFLSHYNGPQRRSGIKNPRKRKTHRHHPVSSFPIVHSGRSSSDYPRPREERLARSLPPFLMLLVSRTTTSRGYACCTSAHAASDARTGEDVVGPWLQQSTSSLGKKLTLRLAWGPAPGEDFSLQMTLSSIWQHACLQSLKRVI